ncbi:HAMP domain-containing histidine kinase [Vagococcus sp. BWB3-3]|uniref:Heme sensor protein HssS n=1 Tax=Vagococcus allomyrinae TaxID=2794353 RepID=A0A940PHC1_9ENTE|nr:HAMP domain-containing sensor histidine kinase [Vagococcus allomyrinae]MBP1042938.1 HAMP domain-containing histidine kinase [Vagococcus allomyrinae]
MNETKQTDPRVKSNGGPFLNVIVIFSGLAALTTGQMFILQKYLDYDHLPSPYVIAIVVYWLFVAILLTIFIQGRFKQKYQRPMEELAAGTRKVAEGDFSVYIPPRHLPAKWDAIDVIFADFNVMVEELGSIETLKTDFFSNVSHEIKTPLSVIQNYAEALKLDTTSPEQKESYLETIIDSSARLANLITNLLKLNKLEKQTLQPVPDPYDLCRQLTDCALNYEEWWSTKEIEFIAEIDDYATIEADASLLELVWNNLLSNAIKFSEPGGTVTMTQTSTANQVIVSITDSGCGMSDDTLKHMFDKFYQGDSSHATEGNGLGLALVLRILQLMGGTIAATSKLHQGTTMTVRLPLQHNINK